MIDLQRRARTRQLLGVGLTAFVLWSLGSAATGDDVDQAADDATGQATMSEDGATNRKNSAGETRTGISAGLRRWVEPTPKPVSADESLTPEQRQRDDLLRKRVIGRWEAMVARDFDQVYTYETSAFREQTSAKDYAKTFGSMVDWHAAEVYSVEYKEPDTADVTVRLTYSFPNSTGDDAVSTVGYFTEEWVYQGTSWWRNQRTEPLGFAQPAASPTAKQAN